jgi:uncharacterized membrane protein
MHPFDLKAALMAKHAQHVVLIHFPIALFLCGSLFDFAAHWTHKATLAVAAYYNLIVAAVASLPVMVTGIIAWRLHLEGQALKGILLQHLVLASVSTVLIWIAWWIHFRAARAQHTAPAYRLGVEGVGVIAIAMTAHLGGFLSGVNLP